MGRVKVKLFANLRLIAGMNEVELEIGDRATIKDVLDKTVEKFGPKFERNIKDTKTGELTPFLIMIGRKEISSVRGDLSTKVFDGDEISLLEPVGGGVY
ncbi:MAG: MoaD family protein [Candidatus Aminicenantes bacterium]|nr:MAG: MoaD family protein [Candidatus Aminicenantes bacterium]